MTPALSFRTPELTACPLHKDHRAQYVTSVIQVQYRDQPGLTPLFTANYVDVYEIKPKTLKHIQSGSVVPPCR